jgi:WD40 repeat protein
VRVMLRKRRSHRLISSSRAHNFVDSAEDSDHRQRKSGTGISYAAFISYSHALDGKLAPALQSGLQRFAKPWYRLRALRVFRDEASLSANPGLWSSIQTALGNSEFFILLASPEAARSDWVAREARYWVGDKPLKNFLIALTNGELVWDHAAGDFDWSKTTALPLLLRGVFAEEPRYIDLRWARTEQHLSLTEGRFRNAVAELAAPLHHRAKDDLAGEDVLQHRRTVRIARVAIAILIVLVLAASSAALAAVGQAKRANNQARIATARALASAAIANLGTRLDVAQLLAVQAYRMSPDPQTRSALIQAVTSSPNLVRYLPMGGQVVTLSGSTDRGTVVAGLHDGRVQRWGLAEPKPRTVLAFHAAISSLAVSRDGAVIVASDGTDAMLWQRGRSVTAIKGPAGQHAGAVALSPSGRTAVVHMSEPSFEGPQSTIVFDVPTRTTLATHDGPDDPTKGLASPSLLVAPSDDELLLLDEGYGGWERRRISDWSLEASSNAAFGVHNYAVGVSSDGGSFTETNGASRIPVWRTNRPSDYDHPGFTAQAPISSPVALTLSPDGTKVAVADSGTIFVSPVASDGAARDDPIQLVGNGSINRDGVRFFGDDSHLLSASSDKIAVWDLGQPDRIARTARTPVPPACNACSGPRVAVAPDGRRVAIIGGDGTSLVIQTLDQSAAHQLKTVASVLTTLNAPPVWDATGRRILLPVARLPGGSNVSAPTGLSSVAGSEASGDRGGQIVAAGRGGDDRTVVVVNANGEIRVHDIESGAVRRTVPGPEDLAEESRALQTNGAVAAVDSTGNLVAIVDNGSVMITDLIAGKIIRTIPGPDASSVAFSGRRLLVQRGGGNLEVWDQRGSALERVLPGDDSYDWPPVANQQGTMVARQRSNGSILLADLDNGAVLATFPSASGSNAFKTGIAFSPDGTRLITVTESADLGIDARLIWRDISDDALVHTACETTGRNLTRAEWQTFVGTSAPQDLSCR